MNKTRIILHIVLIISIITTIISGFQIEKNEKEYMPEEEANRMYAAYFYEEAARILESIGVLAEFADKYGNDENEVVEGLTVAELKKEYHNSEAVDNYRNMLNNIFYYNEEQLEEGQWYIADSGDYYDKESVKKYGYTSHQEYEEALAYYSAIINFFSDYNAALEAEHGTQFPVTNMYYIVRYTDVNGDTVVYTKDDTGEINSDSMIEYPGFIFEKKGGIHAEMNVLDKDLVDFDSLVYKCKTFTDYDDFYASFIINTDYPYNDSYSYYGEEVVTDEEEIARFNSMIVIFAFAATIGGIILITLMFLTGRIAKGSTKLYKMDNIWWDILGICIIVAFSIVIIVFEITSILEFSKSVDYLCMQIYLIALAEIVVIYVLSLIRRIKAKSFLKSSVCGKCLIRIGRLLKKLWNNINATKKAFILLVATFVYLLVISMTAGNGFYYGNDFFKLMWLMFAVVFLVFIFFIMWKFIIEYEEIIKQTKMIANGDISNKITAKIQFKSNRQMAEAVNNIGEGISKAVDDSIKNERMKTDLITNVSHDIKTPLTSIINYVNLLRMEDIKDEKVSNYINVLESKSQRLKILTDDLVEASKLSSGVIKLEFDKLNLVELIKQSAGEYEEKFAEKNLEVVMDLPMSPVYVKADGRKMWRVLENLYGNIYKYAMKGTRVYVDLSMIGSRVILVVKNISDGALNLKGDELTERFIRGDVSRSTEGSGLGLSIAKSIIDRHGGEFKIVLDGDLFKVVIKLDEYKEIADENK